MTLKPGDRVYYDHGDNDPSDTGTVMSDPEYIPEEDGGITRMASTEVWVLFDNATPSGNKDNLIQTSVANLRKI